MPSDQSAVAPSLAYAAKSTGGRLRSGRCAAPLVAARPGGAGGGGAVLLPLGAEVVRLYRALEQGAAGAGADELARLQAVLASPPS